MHPGRRKTRRRATEPDPKRSRGRTGFALGPPQRLSSVDVSAGYWQTPLTHCPEWQARPQAPQLPASVKMFTSQPSLTEPLQFANPLLQVMEPPQTPLLHVAPRALGTLQGAVSAFGAYEQFPVDGSHVPA
jgi:hypothetical protein